MKINQFKIRKIYKKIGLLIVVLMLVPSLLVDNHQKLVVSLDEKNSDKLSGPQFPRESTVYYLGFFGGAGAVDLNGGYAYIGSGGSGLVVINVFDPTNPGPLAFEATNASAHGVHVSGNFAYVAAGASGLAIFNISNPTNPGAPVYRDTTGDAFNVYVSGDFAYVADLESGLAIINISDPTNPGAPVYRDLGPSGEAINVYVSGDYAYIVDRVLGLGIINISDPTNPGAPVYRGTSGQAWDVYVRGDFAYVASGGSGLAIINISDPTNPGAPVYRDTTMATGVYVHGYHAYISAGNSGLAVINVFDPTNPGVAVYQDTTGYAGDVYVSVHGNYAYVADSSSGLAIIHIREMLAPVIIDTPDDFSVDFGYTGVDISWTATDQDPINYTIALQGTGIVSGPSTWSNGTEVIYNVTNGLPIGEYTYTITFIDDYGNFTTDTITVSVIDVANPIITSAPSDFTVDFGYTGKNISWTATDQTPNTYNITLQGVGTVYGPRAWSNGTPITYNIPEDLVAGEYIYTIKFIDDYDNFITDTVTMTINERESPAIISFGIYFTIPLLFGVILVILRSRKKYHKQKT